MRYGVLGTGMVGSTLATKLVSMGNDVMIGSRTANNDKALKWKNSFDGWGKIGTFADAAKFVETLLGCTDGDTSIKDLKSCDGKDLERLARLLERRDIVSRLIALIETKRSMQRASAR